ncbi:MAG: HPP family protein [Sulfuricella sp.]
MTIAAIFSRLFPQQANVTHRERLISGAGGVLAILLTTLVAHYAIGGVTLPFMLASMGASTVLLLGAPHSPLSQPWAFAGGHFFSALIGVTCAMYVPNIYWAAGLSVGLSISAMYYLRCLHPPGGATALLTVIGDQKIHELGYHFLVMPVLVNVAILLGVALLVNKLIPGRRYPTHQSMAGKGETSAAKAAAPVKLGFNRDDLVSALGDMGGFIDVSGEDLTRIYSLATLHAHKRGMGKITLGRIMTRGVVTIQPDTELQEIWRLMREHAIRGMPVVNQENQLVGMVSVVDFLKMADWRMCDSITQRMQFFLRRKKTLTPAERIMSAPVITLTEDRTLTEAFLIFAEKGINHLPITDAGGRLTGILTRLDLLSALYGDLGAVDFRAQK